VTETDRLVANASAYQARYANWAGRPGRPSLGVTVVTCMDARIDVYSLFGLEPGEVHVIRNAGGLITDDAIRSLAISQRLLGTTEIVLVHHTGCGMQGLDDDDFAAQLSSAAGRQPPWRAGGFADPVQDVRDSMAAVMADPFIPNKNVRGFVFDVESGRLLEVS
jgi:carbonic anhydrase